MRDSLLHLKLLAATLLAAAVAANTQNLDATSKVHLKFNAEGNFEIVNTDQYGLSPNWLVKGEYKNSVNSTGWGFLNLASNQVHADKLQAYGAGYYEGYVTSQLLYMSYQNTIVGRCDGKEKLCQTIDKWVDESLVWTRKKIRQHKKKSAYWHQVSLFLDQMSGISHGYQVAMKGQNKTITFNDILTMNIFGDLEDLESALSDPQQKMPNKVQGKGRCSALIRLLPGNSDLLASHDTWNSYQSMLRLIKKYELPYRKHKGSSERVPGHTMSFSGYPGIIYSGDDFTIASSGLTIIETTIGNSNPELWKLVKPQTLLEGIRSTVANRLAVNGSTWTKIFSRHNSGTYNNQWMVVDYNRFTPGKPVQDHTLWILEQIPGYIEAKDLTQVLRDQEYWPSYNTPFFKKVFNMSGDLKLMKKFGDWFSYEKTPRARIFARDAPNVDDIESMIKLMRYNNYTKDPLSACPECTPPYSAENAISARNDLNPRDGKYPFPALSHRSHGGTDMKLTSHSMAMDYEMIVQGGPTWDPLPAFRWSEQDFKDTPHIGHPDLWQFQPIRVKWE